MEAKLFNIKAKWPVESWDEKVHIIEISIKTKAKHVLMDNGFWRGTGQKTRYRRSLLEKLWIILFVDSIRKCFDSIKVHKKPEKNTNTVDEVWWCVRIYLNASNEKTYRFWLNPMKNARKTPGTWCFFDVVFVIVGLSLVQSAASAISSSHSCFHIFLKFEDGAIRLLLYNSIEPVKWNTEDK